MLMLLIFFWIGLEQEQEQEQEQDFFGRGCPALTMENSGLALDSLGVSFRQNRTGNASSHHEHEHGIDTGSIEESGTVVIHCIVSNNGGRKSGCHLRK